MATSIKDTAVPEWRLQEILRITNEWALCNGKSDTMLQGALHILSFMPAFTLGVLRGYFRCLRYYAVCFERFY